MVRRFAAVMYPVPGLLCLGEIEHVDGVGDSIVHDIRSILQQGGYRRRGACRLVRTSGGQGPPYEVSLTRKLATYELLTEAAPDVSGR